MVATESVLSHDQHALAAPAWYLPLPEVDVTLASGPDTLRFLQGQLSCNMQKLSAEHALRGALCNIKGRVITDLMLVQNNSDILILNWHGTQSHMLTTLNKYRVFFKCTLETAASALQVFGVGGTDSETLEQTLGLPMPQQTDEVSRAGALTVVRLASHTLARYLVIVDKQADKEAIDRVRKLPQLPSACWQLADIRDGIVHVKPEQSEVYTPQLLNYDINGTIDFKKGCYTGQEVVARMFYRAEAKRRLYHFSATDAAALDQILSGMDTEDIVVQLALPDGSIEGLAVFPVAGAVQRAGVTPLEY